MLLSNGVNDRELDELGRPMRLLRLPNALALNVNLLKDSVKDFFLGVSVGRPSDGSANSTWADVTLATPSSNTAGLDDMFVFE